MVVIHLAQSVPLPYTLAVSARNFFLSSIALLARLPKSSRPLVQTSQLRGSLTSVTIFRHEGRVNNPHCTNSTRHLPMTMDKVWFKLRQTHYPPPPEAAIFGGCTGIEAPICLGHILRDPESFDYPMNPQGIEPLPPNMPVFPTSRTKFQWDDVKSHEKGMDTGASAPVATAAGVTAGGDIKLEFSKSVGSHEEYERLDTYIMQPTQSYISESLEEQPLSHGLGREWTVFMVTGLRVARKGASSASDSSGATIGMGVDRLDPPFKSTEPYKLLTLIAALPRLQKLA
jgi:hypothetical protein